MRHGGTGFLVRVPAGSREATIEEAVRAVHLLPGVDRAGCRAEAVRRFSADRMVEAYLALFRKVLQAGVGSDTWSRPERFAR